MKRIFKLSVVMSLLVACGLLAAAPVYTQVAGVDAPMQTTVTIGVILYELDAAIWDPMDYQSQLEIDTWMLPSRSPMTRYPDFTIQTRFTNPVKVVIKEAGTVEAQIAALNELAASKVDGIVLAPVSGSEALQKAVQDVLCKEIPVVLVWRDLPIVNRMDRLAYVGIDAFRAGWSMAMARVYRALPEGAKVVIVMSDENDPLQIGLKDGFMFAVNEANKGPIIVTQGDGYDAIKQLLKDFSTTLNTVFLTDTVKLGAGAVRAQQESETRFAMAGWGVPFNESEVMGVGKIKGVGRVDEYDMLVDATTMLKEHLTNFAPLVNKYVTLETYRGIAVCGYGNRAYTSHPYPYYRGIQGMW